MAKFLRAGRDLSGKTAARDHARLTARVVARGAAVAGHAMVPISPDIRDRRDALGNPLRSLPDGRRHPAIRSMRSAPAQLRPRADPTHERRWRRDAGFVSPEARHFNLLINQVFYEAISSLHAPASFSAPRLRYRSHRRNGTKRPPVRFFVFWNCAGLNE